jgi:hypothetical protein
MTCNLIQSLILLNNKQEALRNYLLIIGDKMKNNLYCSISPKNKENIDRTCLEFQKSGLENG